MLRHIGLITLCTALCGCAATGQKYSEYSAALKPASTGSARILVYRTDEYRQYSGRDARVSIDSTITGKVAYKGFAVFEVPAGSHVLVVDMWDSPGACTLSIEAAASEEYYFEVAPRTGNFIGGFLGGIIGAAIESAGKECGGAFAIAQVPKSGALPVLTQLRVTE